MMTLEDVAKTLLSEGMIGDKLRQALVEQPVEVIVEWYVSVGVDHLTQQASRIKSKEAIVLTNPDGPQPMSKRRRKLLELDPYERWGKTNAFGGRTYWDAVDDPVWLLLKIVHLRETAVGTARKADLLQQALDERAAGTDKIKVMQQLQKGLEV